MTLQTPNGGLATATSAKVLAELGDVTGFIKTVVSNSNNVINVRYFDIKNPSATYDISITLSEAPLPTYQPSFVAPSRPTSTALGIWGGSGTSLTLKTWYGTLFSVTNDKALSELVHVSGFRILHLDTNNGLARTIEATYFPTVSGRKIARVSIAISEAAPGSQQRFIAPTPPSYSPLGIWGGSGDLLTLKIENGKMATATKAAILGTTPNVPGFTKSIISGNGGAVGIIRIKYTGQIDSNVTGVISIILIEAHSGDISIEHNKGVRLSWNPHYSTSKRIEAVANKMGNLKQSIIDNKDKIQLLINAYPNAHIEDLMILFATKYLNSGGRFTEDPDRPLPLFSLLVASGGSSREIVYNDPELSSPNTDRPGVELTLANGKKLVIASYYTLSGSETKFPNFIYDGIRTTGPHSGFIINVRLRWTQH